MKHPATRELYQYWNQRRGARRAPDRADIEPGHFRTRLGDTFMLSVDATGGHPFRIAGTRLCALFCRELKATPFVDLWDRRDHMAGLLQTVVQDGVGLVAGAHATLDDTRIDLEVLVLPLTQGGSRPARFIGTLASFGTPYWLGVRPATRMVLGIHRHVGGPLERGRRFISGAEADRVREGLRVLDGGRL